MQFPAGRCDGATKLVARFFLAPCVESLRLLEIALRLRHLVAQPASLDLPLLFELTDPGDARVLDRADAFTATWLCHPELSSFIQGAVKPRPRGLSGRTQCFADVLPAGAVRERLAHQVELPLRQTLVQRSAGGHGGQRRCVDGLLPGRRHVIRD